MKKVLVTGFDPFGGEPVNPALMSVMQLPDEILGVQIIKKEIPTVFDKSIEVLYQTLKEEQPDMVMQVVVLILQLSVSRLIKMMRVFQITREHSLLTVLFLQKVLLLTSQRYRLKQWFKI